MALLSATLFIVSFFLVFVVLFASLKAEYKVYILIYLFVVMLTSLGRTEFLQKSHTSCTCKCEVLNQHHQTVDEEQN